MNAILSFLTGLFAIVLMMMKNASEKKHEKEALRKEVDNAVENGDLARLNALIQHINNKL